MRFFAKHLIGSKSAMQAPFIQMICAALTVKVSMNTLPFHFHLLTCISEAPFPIPSAIGALLHAASVLSQANSKQEHGKPRVLHLPTLLTVSDSETGTRSYHDAAVDEAFYLILKYLTGISTEASFPELIRGCHRVSEVDADKESTHQATHLVTCREMRVRVCGDQGCEA